MFALYHPSQFLCSQSWLHLWLWHVFFWTNKLCFQILSFSHSRQPSNSSSSSSSLYSHSSCKFLCLQQTWLYCNLLYSGISQSTNLNKLQRIQNSLTRVITNTSKYQHITPTLKNYTGFQSNTIIYDLSLVCVLIWLARPPFHALRYSHWPHANGFSPDWFMLCGVLKWLFNWCFNMATFANVPSHFGHTHGLCSAVSYG